MTQPDDFEKIPYKPRPPQDEIHEVLNRTRFVVLVAHRRMGKTVLAVIHLIRQARACKRERGFFGYVAPFRNQAKAIAWRYLTHYTAGVRQNVNETELSITLKTVRACAFSVRTTRTRCAACILTVLCLMKSP